MSLSRWEAFGMAQAKMVAALSKDPSTQVGAYISSPDHRPISFGFNGFPRGIADDARLYTRELKYDMIIHAEMNALLNANGSVKDGTLYMYPMLPCSRCAVMLIQAGIKKVYAPMALSQDRWQAEMNLTRNLFEEAGIGYFEIN